MARRKRNRQQENVSIADSLGCGVAVIGIIGIFSILLSPWFLLLIPIAVLIMIGYIIDSVKKSSIRKSNLKSIDDYVVRLVRHELTLSEQKDWRENLDWNGWGTEAEAALRCVEILAQSSYHALKSKNQDTAKSNFDTVQMEWRAFNGQRTRDDMRPVNCRQYFSDEAVSEITNCYERTLSGYHDAVLNNHVNGVLEKAAKLKTAKGRQKYYALATIAIESAKKEGKASINVIHRLERGINELLENG